MIIWGMTIEMKWDWLLILDMGGWGLRLYMIRNNGDNDWFTIVGNDRRWGCVCQENDLDRCILRNPLDRC